MGMCHGFLVADHHSMHKWMVKSWASRESVCTWWVPVENQMTYFLMIEQQISLLFDSTLVSWNVIRKVPTENASQYSDESQCEEIIQEKSRKTPKTFCSLLKLQNQTTLNNSLQVEKPHPPIVWKSCEEWSLFDSTSHPEDISGFISTWSSLGPLIIHIDFIFIQCNGQQDRDACSTLWKNSR